VSAPHGWGPERRRAAVAVTFDNLGEVTELQRGQWPAGEPVGRHHSVTEALPRVLDALGGQGLAATFFVEGLNAELYPDALTGIAAAGHEVALHGWCHEPWAELEEARERELLARGTDALGALGLRPVGFRPPGGRLTAASQDALTEAGFAYVSPAGRGVAVWDGLAVLPFRWALLDAVHYGASFAGMRQTLFGSPDTLSPAALRATLADALAGALERGELLVLLFHPFLADAGDRVAAMETVLAQVRAVADAGDAWCAPLRDVAAWAREQPDASRWDLELDATPRRQPPGRTGV
jgi:peptidoglycan/xylan/chitin deacetylase (PgdA/CDA1 family)